MLPPNASVPVDEGTASPLTAEPPTTTATGLETAMTPSIGTRASSYPWHGAGKQSGRAGNQVTCFHAQDYRHIPFCERLTELPLHCIALRNMETQEHEHVRGN